MSFEIEKKYRLTPERRESLAAELRSSGAEFVRREFEENTIYSNNELADRGAILRIRKTDSRSILTFKRRLENQSDVKRQVEHETEVADACAAAAIVDELGLRPVLVYEKWRDTWRFRGVEVVIDELPFGLFMEVEGTLTGIKEAEIVLDLEDSETEHETYPRLTAKFGKEHHGIWEARFEK